MKQTVEDVTDATGKWCLALDYCEPRWIARVLEQVSERIELDDLGDPRRHLTCRILCPATFRPWYQRCSPPLESTVDMGGLPIANWEFYESADAAYQGAAEAFKRLAADEASLILRAAELLDLDQKGNPL